MICLQKLNFTDLNQKKYTNILPKPSPELTKHLTGESLHIQSQNVASKPQHLPMQPAQMRKNLGQRPSLKLQCSDFQLQSPPMPLQSPQSSVQSPQMVLQSPLQTRPTPQLIKHSPIVGGQSPKIPSKMPLLTKAPTQLGMPSPIIGHQTQVYTTMQTPEPMPPMLQGIQFSISICTLEFQC